VRRSSTRLSRFRPTSTTRNPGDQGRGRIAGLEVKRIVNEPTAAALAYGLDKKKDELIACTTSAAGPSTFHPGSCENVVEVVSTNGDTHLGGDDIDVRIMDWLIAEFRKDQGHRRVQGQDGAAAPARGSGKAKSSCPSDGN